MFPLTVIAPKVKHLASWGSCWVAKVTLDVAHFICVKLCVNPNPGDKYQLERRRKTERAYDRWVTLEIPLPRIFGFFPEICDSYDRIDVDFISHVHVIAQETSLTVSLPYWLYS